MGTLVRKFIEREVNMNKQIQVSAELFSLKVAQLQNEIAILQTQLEYERKLRQEKEQELIELKATIPKKRRKRTPEEQKQAESMEYTPYTSDGRKKPTKADNIGSYEDYININNYLGNKVKNGIRNQTIWTLGIALGFRVSDLCKLKYKYFFRDDWTIRPRVIVYEQKTLKINNALITEVVEKILMKHIKALKHKPDLNDYVFKGQGSNHIGENTIYKILKPAQKDLNLSFNFSTHTMRKSFANIAACCGIKSVDMNTIAVVQGLLNHNDQSTTLRYLGKFEEMYDNAREAVSDFLLGKLDKTLEIQSKHNVDDIYEKIEEICNQLIKKESDINECNKSKSVGGYM